MKPSEILKSALELLGPEGQQWTRGTYARNKRGDSTFNRSEMVCFCSIGALRVAAFGGTVMNLRDDVTTFYMRARSFLFSAAEKRAKNGLVNWQDHPDRKFPEVRQMFLDAITEAESEEKLAA